MNVEYAIVSGGRAAVINEALFSAYREDVSRAFQLVLLTQCHNPEAHQSLVHAGRNAVVTYLVDNWTPVGVDPEIIEEGIEVVVSILGEG